MHRLVLLLTLGLPSTAAALTDPRTGFYAQVGGGGIVAGGPVAGAAAWQAGTGVWHGSYDDDYSLGRFWSGGVGLRQDLRRGDLHTAVVAEVRRGVDILVVGWHGFVAAGPTIGEDLGLLAEAGLGVKGRFRFSGPFVGWQLRVQGGVEAGADQVVGRGMLTAGIEFAAPFKRGVPAE